MAPKRTLPSLTPYALLARLGCRPDYMSNSMISIAEPIQSTLITSSLAPPSIMGAFGTFPAELLHLIFNSLDFRSLLRFLRVCHQTKSMVESFPTYQRMMAHASTALIALGRTRLITYHTTATIHAALLSDKCICCEQHGAFLFLPSCERCCYQCLHTERSLRVIPVSMAEMCFSVGPKDLRRIPIMLSIPGTYCVGQEVTRRRRVRLVSIKQAEALGVSVHGSRTAMLFASGLDQMYGVPLSRFLPARWMSGAATDYPPDDSFCGMASIAFASLRLHGANELEHVALWCGPCQKYLDNYHHHSPVTGETYTQLLVAGRIPELAFGNLVQNEPSRMKFLKHVRECRGARQFLTESPRLSR